jgi:hypothetical protein
VRYGAQITLSASSTSGLPVTFSVVTGPGKVNGNVLTFSGVGYVGVTANQAGNSDYAEAIPVLRSILVGKASLTIHANNASAGLDWTIPKLTYTLTGFVNGETSSVVSGAPVETTTATKGSPIGNYPIEISQGTLSAANYGGWATVNGILSIKKPQTITFTQPTSPVRYGVTPITLSASASSGLPVSLTVDGPATLNGSTLTITGVGTVVLRANQAGNSSYTVAAQVVREIVVDKADLTIHATSASVAVNKPIPSLTYTLTGFVNGDTASVVSGAPVETTTAKQGSAAGKYPITITAGTLSAANYGGWAVVDGTLTITQ